MFASALRNMTNYFLQVQLCPTANPHPGLARHGSESDKEGNSVLDLRIVHLDEGTSEKVSLIRLELWPVGKGQKNITQDRILTAEGKVGSRSQEETEQ